GLVGAGRGLTPSGDDALCGVLLTLAAVDSAAARSAHLAVRAAVTASLTRTTSISAALLAAAAQGYAVPDVVRLVTRWSAGGQSRAAVGAADGADELLDRVLAIGHTSGRDLLSGVTGALRALDAIHDASLPEGAHRG
ncbi:MAG: hypothetical protein JWP82_894, partial [Humibacillus sp.]|nr:hypothetical protein [Humibacillus sp.]